MPRRRVAAKREVLPDPKFQNKTLAKFMNHVMVDGKKSVAEKIVYGALDVVSQKAVGSDSLEIFEKAHEAIASSAFSQISKESEPTALCETTSIAVSYTHLTLPTKTEVLTKVHCV